MKKLPDRLMDCPACAGEGGAVIELDHGFDGFWGSEPHQDWRTCRACGGAGRLRRGEAVLWLTSGRRSVAGALVEAA